MEPPKSFLRKVLESAIMLAVSGFLVDLAVRYVWGVRFQLLIIGLAGLIVVGGVRLYRYFHQRQEWREYEDDLP